MHVLLPSLESLVINPGFSRIPPIHQPVSSSVLPMGKKGTHNAPQHQPRHAQSNTAIKVKKHKGAVFLAVIFCKQTTQKALLLMKHCSFLIVIPSVLNFICSLALLRIRTHSNLSFTLCEYIFNVKLFPDTKSN